MSLIDQMSVVLHSVEDEGSGEIVDSTIGPETEFRLLNQVQRRRWEGDRFLWKHILLQQEAHPT